MNTRQWFLTVAGIGLTGACTVDLGGGPVTPPPPPPVDCTSMVSGASLGVTSVTLEVGRRVFLNPSATVTGGGAGCHITGESLTSSDTNVATVIGVTSVAARGPGTAIITFAAGGARAQATVTVEATRSTFIAASGADFTVTFLTSDGEVFTAGRGGGDGNPYLATTWKDLRLVTLDAGPSRTCGIAADRRLFCTPNPLSVTPDVIAVDAGGYGHLCYVTGSGPTWCGGVNTYGQLGSATALLSQTPLAPVVVSGGHRFTQLALGLTHSCGLATDGTLWCWGDNSDGQLGSTATTAACGSPARACQPTPIRAADSLTFTAITAGAAHTCGVATDGKAWCWGRNLNGQLGSTDTTSGAAPHLVAGDLRFTTLSGGETRTCGLTTEGDAWCWGQNDAGGARSRTPMPVPGGLHVSAITVSRDQNCGIVSAVAYCWAEGPGNSLGTPVRVPGQAN